MTTQTMGLRERKRLQTRHSLQEAAIGLALRDGLDKVTVDAISERANVSPRTFFNYFDSKEDAILGVLPGDVSDEVLAAHRVRYAGSDLVESLVGFVIGVVGPSISDPAFRKARMQVIRQHPQLMDAMIGRMTVVNEQFAAAVRVLAQESNPPGTEVSVAVAETLFMTCVGGIKAAARQWTTTDLDLSLQDMEQRAVALVRETIEIMK